MNSKQLVTVSPTQQTVMYFTTLWNLLLWSTLLKENKDNLFLLATVIGLWIELYNKYNLFHFKAKPLADEIKQSHRASPSIETQSLSKPFECTLKYMINNQSYNQSLENRGHELPLYSIVRVTLTIGEARLEKQLRSMFKLFDSLREYKITSSKPSKFKMLKRLLPQLPHTTLNFDMPTKARYLEFLIFPGYYAGKSLATLLNLTPTSQIIFVAAFAGISWTLNALDSYDLDKITDQYKLEGFTHYYQSWYSFPPTCLGGQLTRKLEFRPHNSALRNSVQTIFHGEKILEKLKNDANFLQTLDHETAELLRTYEPLTFRF